MLRAIPLEAGDHRIELEYAPWAYRAGVVVSALSALALAGACLARLLWVRTGRPPSPSRRAERSA